MEDINEQIPEIKVDNREFVKKMKQNDRSSEIASKSFKSKFTILSSKGSRLTSFFKFKTGDNTKPFDTDDHKSKKNKDYFLSSKKVIEIIKTVYNKANKLTISTFKIIGKNVSKIFSSTAGIIGTIFKKITGFLAFTLSLITGIIGGIIGILGGLFKIIFNIIGFVAKVLFTAVSGVFKLVINSTKYLLKQIMKMTRWSFPILKYLIFTKPVMYGIGFIAGVIYESILKPIGETAKYIYDNWDIIKENLSLSNLKQTAINFGDQVIEFIQNKAIIDLEQYVSSSEVSDELFMQLNDMSKSLTSKGLYGISETFKAFIDVLNNLFSHFKTSGGELVGGTIGSFAGQLVGSAFGGELTRLVGAVLGGTIGGILGNIIGSTFEVNRQLFTGTKTQIEQWKEDKTSGGIISKTSVFSSSKKSTYHELSKRLQVPFKNGYSLHSNNLIKEDGSGEYDKKLKELSSILFKNENQSSMEIGRIIRDKSFEQEVIDKSKKHSPFNLKDFYNEDGSKRDPMDRRVGNAKANILKSRFERLKIHDSEIDWKSNSNKIVEKYFKGDFYFDYLSNTGLTSKIILDAIDELAEINSFFKDNKDKIFYALRNQRIKQINNEIKNNPGKQDEVLKDVLVEILNDLDNLNLFTNAFDYLVKVKLPASFSNNKNLKNKLETILTLGITQVWYDEFKKDHLLNSFFKVHDWNTSNHIDSMMNQLFKNKYNVKDNPWTMDRFIKEFSNLNSNEFKYTMEESELLSEFRHPLYDKKINDLNFITCASNEALDTLKNTGINIPIDEIYNSDHDDAKISQIFLTAYTHEFLKKLSPNFLLQEIGEKSIEKLKEDKIKNEIYPGQIFQKEIINTLKSEGYGELLNGLLYYSNELNESNIIKEFTENLDNWKKQNAKKFTEADNELYNTAMTFINNVFKDHEIDETELEQIKQLRSKLTDEKIRDILDLILRKNNLTIQQTSNQQNINKTFVFNGLIGTPSVSNVALNIAGQAESNEQQASLFTNTILGWV